MLTRTFMLTVLLATTFLVSGQDSLQIKDLEHHTTYFRLDDQTLTEPGTAFFRQAFSRHQYILLGEYHGSPAISSLIRALLPIYQQAGGRHFALEVGPVSAEILSTFAATPERTEERIKENNRKYLTTGAKRSYCPIPFFSHRSDAAFLGESGRLNLRIIGLDQEYKFGFLSLADHAFHLLPTTEQRELGADYLRLRDTLINYYEKEIDYYDKRTEEGKRFVGMFHHSPFVNAVLDRLGAASPEAANIVVLLRQSAEIYRQSSLRHYWRSNELRNESFVSNLRKGMEATGFSLASDKLLVKMGGTHTAKGMNGYTMFDVGNTLMELARFHGNTSLHTAILSRYHRGADGKVEDELENKQSWYTKSFGDFLQMGRRDEWTIIDLRGLRESVYYWQKYATNDRVREYFDRYDVVLIAPIDGEGVNNY